MTFIPKCFWLPIFLIFLSLSCTKKIEEIRKIQLNDHWKFQINGQWMTASVPGTIHTDLLKNKLIEDPFWETNEDSLQWIEKENWTYRRNFTLDKKSLNYQNITLVFEGLDTYAAVFLNGQKILRADNMFRSWKTDIKTFLKEGENQLEVKFRSPIIENKEKVINYAYQLPSGNETVDIKVSPFTRKAAHQFGWDWGPRFVGCGIWRPVYIEAWNDARINFVHTQIKLLDQKRAEVNIEAEVQVSKPQRYTLAINEQTQEYDLKEGRQVLKMTYAIANPILWWPNGLGDAHLYDLEIKLLQKGQLLDKNQQKVGLRTIELINEADSIGTSFYFKVNGVPVFMKGANYIPQDIFTGNFNKEKYKNLLQKVQSANMNMLRVWGGGIYENDLFYDLCDEYGILVWQDFMFAGSLYPETPSFLENIKKEVQQNIIRLRNHPCLALWCGNNEIEVAWNNWGWQKQYGYSSEDSIAIWHNYLNIFEKIIPEQVKELDNNRAYVPTSPLSNWGTPENFNHSSMHYWGVWHGREPIENYKTNIGRFMVEYGFQSFPNMETINSFAADSSLYLDSETMKRRQKSYIGNGLINNHVKKWYGQATSFDDFVEKNQRLQAEALKMAIKSHRRHKPHCMGTLFWQLNDCWPGISWSVLDYYGREKLAMNVVKKYYQPLIAVAEEIQDSLAVFIVSDLQKKSTVQLELSIKTREGAQIWHFSKVYNLQKNSVLPAAKWSLRKILNKYPRQAVKVEVQLQSNGQEIFKDDIHLVPQ